MFNLLGKNAKTKTKNNIEFCTTYASDSEALIHRRRYSWYEV